MLRCCLFALSEMEIIGGVPTKYFSLVGLVTANMLDSFG